MQLIENDPATEKRMRDFAQTLSEKDRRRFAAIEAVQQAFVNCGRSMLRRFQMGGKTLESEVVSDRLLLTY